MSSDMTNACHFGRRFPLYSILQNMQPFYFEALSKFFVKLKQKCSNLHEAKNSVKKYWEGNNWISCRHQFYYLFVEKGSSFWKPFYSSASIAFSLRDLLCTVEILSNCLLFLWPFASSVIVIAFTLWPQWAQHGNEPSKKWTKSTL